MMTVQVVGIEFANSIISFIYSLELPPARPHPISSGKAIVVDL